MHHDTFGRWGAAAGIPSILPFDRAAVLTLAVSETLFGRRPRLPDQPIEQKHMDLAASIQSSKTRSCARHKTSPVKRGVPICASRWA
jgi:hypothetical protein